MSAATITADSITDHCAAGAGAPCDLQPMGAFDDRSGLVGEVSILRCSRCGLGVSRPLIPDVGFLYADRTSVDFQPTTRGLARKLKTFAFTRQARRMLAEAGGAQGTIIDYACGSGLLTACIAASAPTGASVTGVDFHETPPNDLGETPYRPQSRLDDLRGTADLVFAMHVVEHDDDPRKLLRQIASLARPGGVLYIEVPNIDCIWAGVFGRAWDAWYLPYHRVHFSRASLRAVVEASGLRVVRESGGSVPTMGRSIANMLGRQNTTAFILLSALLHPIQVALEWLTRRPAALRIVAVKT